MTDTCSTYVTLVLTVVHEVPSEELVANRYCVGFSLDDPLFQGFDIDRWAEPEMRSILMRSLIDEWTEGALGITGCEEISGSVQWQQIAND
jgi:hypothetical protein